MKSNYMQLFMDKDLALKFVEGKAMEVEQLHMDLQGSHPSSYTTTNKKYMAGDTHALMEEPHERFEHEEESYLQVFEKSTLMEDAIQLLDLMKKDNDLP